MRALLRQADRFMHDYFEIVVVLACTVGIGIVLLVGGTP